MSGSAHPEINRVVAMWNTGQQAAAIEAVQRSAELGASMRAEIARLAAPGKRSLLQVDEVSRRQHKALTALLAAVAAAQPPMDMAPPVPVVIIRP